MGFEDREGKTSGSDMLGFVCGACLCPLCACGTVLSLYGPTYLLKRMHSHPPKMTCHTGYSLPLEGFLYRRPKGKLRLLMDYSTSFDDVWVEQLETRVVLPEGAQHIKPSVSCSCFGVLVVWGEALLTALAVTGHWLSERVAAAAEQSASQASLVLRRSEADCCCTTAQHKASCQAVGGCNCTRSTVLLVCAVPWCRPCVWGGVAVPS